VLQDESGSTAAEYAIILAIIGSVIALAAIALGNAVGGAITHTSSCIASKTNC
jgi:pilus assembly protein Flp/PilA